MHEEAKCQVCRLLTYRPIPHDRRQSHRSLFPDAKTAHYSLQVHAALIVVLTRGGSTARLVAKYRPSIPVLTVAVPVLTTDALTWTCSGESPARQCLITRGLIPLLAEGSARATDSDTTDEILAVSSSSNSQGCLNAKHGRAREIGCALFFWSSGHAHETAGGVTSVRSAEVIVHVSMFQVLESSVKQFKKWSWHKS